MTPLPATDAAYALFHEIAAWIDDVTAGVRDFDDFADTVAGRLIPVADGARDEARAMGERPCCMLVGLDDDGGDER